MPFVRGGVGNAEEEGSVAREDGRDPLPLAPLGLTRPDKAHLAWADDCGHPSVVPIGLFLILTSALLGAPASAGDFSLPSPGDFLRSASRSPVPEVGEATPPVFLRAVLNMAPFKGRSSEETRANAERFAAGLGLTLSQYQDNEAAPSMDVSSQGMGQTPMGRAQRYLLLRGARAALAASASVKEISSDGSGGLTAVFARPLYEEEVAALKARLPAGLSSRVRRDIAMKGLLVQLAVPAGTDAKAAAALVAAHPREIAYCQELGPHGP